MCIWHLCLRQHSTQIIWRLEVGSGLDYVIFLSEESSVLITEGRGVKINYLTRENYGVYRVLSWLGKIWAGKIWRNKSKTANFSRSQFDFCFTKFSLNFKRIYVQSVSTHTPQKAESVGFCYGGEIMADLGQNRHFSPAIVIAFRCVKSCFDKFTLRFQKPSNSCLCTFSGICLCIGQCF